MDNNDISTQTIMPSQTTQISKFDNYIIKYDCVPLGWNNYLNTSLLKDQNCLSYIIDMGITAQDNGLIFNLKPNLINENQNLFHESDRIVNGLFFSKPDEIDSISFKIKIYDIKASPSGSNMEFFFGHVAEKENLGLTNSWGNFILIRIISKIDETNISQPNIFLNVYHSGMYPSSNIGFKTELLPSEEYLIIVGYLDDSHYIEINGKKYITNIKRNIPADRYYFSFGYDLPNDGAFSVKISDFKFNQYSSNNN